MCVSAALVSHIAKMKMFERQFHNSSLTAPPHTARLVKFVCLVVPYCFRLSGFLFLFWFVCRICSYISPLFFNRLDTLGLLIDKQQRSRLGCHCCCCCYMLMFRPGVWLPAMLCVCVSCVYMQRLSIKTS